MILKDTFYTISSIENTESEVIAVVSIDAKHAIFEGHFPENPITPGVVQLEMIKELLAERYKRKMELVSMSNCKFLTILNPNDVDEVTIKLTIKEEDNLIKVSASIVAQEVNYLKMAAIYS